MLGSRSRPYSTECSVRQAQALEQVKSEYEGRYQEKEREIVEVGCCLLAPYTIHPSQPPRSLHHTYYTLRPTPYTLYLPPRRCPPVGSTV
jgi:hypothetical protein